MCDGCVWMCDGCVCVLSSAWSKSTHSQHLDITSCFFPPPWGEGENGWWKSRMTGWPDRWGGKEAGEDMRDIADSAMCAVER